MSFMRKCKNERAEGGGWLQSLACCPGIFPPQCETQFDLLLHEGVVAVSASHRAPSHNVLIFLN